MGRRKKKPADATQLSTQDLMDKVVKAFGSEYDDRNSSIFEHASLRDVSAECKITMLKARKILITARMYSTFASREVQRLYAEGKSIPEIMKRTGLSRASVHSYIPYKKVIYNLPERSVSADRMKRFRERKRLCREFVDDLPGLSRKEAEKRLWEVLEALQGCWFQTLKGLKFRYRIEDGEIIIDGEKVSITKETIFRKIWKMKIMNGNAGGPKQMMAGDTMYLWVIFGRIGIISED